MSESTPTAAETRRLAQTARDRVRFEEEALELSDQVYRVARRLVSIARRGGGPRAADVRARVPVVASVHARHEPARVAAAHPHEPEHRPRPAAAAHAADDEARLEKADYFLYNKLESATSDENPDEERVLERLSQDTVVDALADVPHDFRDVIVLVDIGEFSYADAAQILDIPIGTVMSRLHRGRRILKTELADKAVDRMTDDPCDKCEEMMQPYLDGTLSEDEVREAEAHLDGLQVVREAVSLRGASASLRARRRRPSRCRPSSRLSSPHYARLCT